MLLYVLPFRKNVSLSSLVVGVAVSPCTVLSALNVNDGCDIADLSVGLKVLWSSKVRPFPAALPWVLSVRSVLSSVNESIVDVYLSSLISWLLFLPKIIHLPPNCGLAQPQGLECMACLKLQTHASLTPIGFWAMA